MADKNVETKAKFEKPIDRQLPVLELVVEAQIDVEHRGWYGRVVENDAGSRSKGPRASVNAQSKLEAF